MRIELLLTTSIIFIIISLISKNKKLSKILCAFLYILFLITFSTRTESTPDYLAYKDMYLNPLYYEGTIEFAYLKTCTLFKFLGLNFREFIIIITSLIFICWHLCSKIILNNNNLVIPFSIFISYMGIFYYGIVLRTSISITLCYIAITILIYRKNNINTIIYYLIVTISLGYHQSMIIFYILPLVAFKEYKTIILYLVITISALIPLFNLQSLSTHIIDYTVQKTGFNRFNSYISDYHIIENEGKYALMNIKYIILGFLFTSLRSRLLLPKHSKVHYNFFLNTYILGIVIISTFTFIMAGSRLGMIFLFFEFILISYSFYYSKLNMVIKLLFIVFIILINIYAIFSSIPQLYNY